jgi:hypothetical protein
VKSKICLFIATDNLSKAANIYDDIIEKIIEKFGGFTIINFNNILKKNANLSNENNNFLIIRDKFKSKLDYYNPLKKKDFLTYIKDKEIFAVDCLGKTFDFFEIRKLINKRNVKLILLMNLGFVSNELLYSINSFKGYFFFFKKKINKLIYRFLVLIKYFSNIFIYFESREEIYQCCILNKKEKLANFLPFLNIMYFQNIYKINNKSFDNYIKNKSRLEEKRIIFLDGNYRHGDIIQRENLDVIKLKEKYFKKLEIFFSQLKKNYNQSVEICLHPSSNKKEYQDFFANILVSQNKTYESLVKASVVIFHESSIILDAIIYKKKIISLYTDLFGNYMSNRINYYKDKFDLFSINLDNLENYNMNNIIKDLEAKENKLKVKNLSAGDEERGSSKVIRILNKYIKDHELV